MIAVLVLAAQIVSSFPPLPPAEAAAVLARLDSPANATHRVFWPPADGPLVVVIPSSPTSGPFGEFPRYPAQRQLRCCDAYINGVPMSLGEAQRWQLADQIFGQRSTGPAIVAPGVTSQENVSSRGGRTDDRRHLR